MSGDPPLSAGAVSRRREETASARGSFPLLNRAFRIVERL
jgi:hypothetical protein